MQTRVICNARKEEEMERRAAAERAQREKQTQQNINTNARMHGWNKK